MSRYGIVFLRNYSRWAHRQPTQIYYPELQSNDKLNDHTVIDLDTLSDKLIKDSGGSTKTERQKRRERFIKEKCSANKYTGIDLKKVGKLTHHIKVSEEVGNKVDFSKIAVKKKYDNSKIMKILNTSNERRYEKLSNQEPKMASLIVKLKSKATRFNNNQVLVEGHRLIKDGIDAGCKLQKIIFSRIDDYEKMLPSLKPNVEAYKMPYKEMEEWSDLETCPGIMGIFELPKPEMLLQKHAKKVFPINIICDNIREPGNLGAILRAAVGVGCQKVILTKGCTHLWDSKVLRSGAGAHFRIPIYTKIGWEEISENLGDTSVFIASNTELKAVGDNTLNNSHEKKYEKDILEDNEIKEIENNEIIKAEDNKTVKTENSNIEVNLPIIPYYSTDFGNLKEITLIIGGETHGISDDCLRFGEECNATCLQIPLMNGVDSLNVGMALAVIAFEMKKQITLYADRETTRIKILCE